MQIKTEGCSHQQLSSGNCDQFENSRNERTGSEENQVYNLIYYSLILPRVWDRYTKTVSIEKCDTTYFMVKGVLVSEPRSHRQTDKQTDTL